MSEGGEEMGLVHKKLLEARATASSISPVIDVQSDEANETATISALRKKLSTAISIDTSTDPNVSE